MAKLSAIEKRQFERLFDMGSGYVLDFSNRTFREFILDSVGIDIYEEKYNYWSGSKANRLRAFWNQEPDPIVGKLLLDLLEYWKSRKEEDGEDISHSEANLYHECLAIASRLKQAPFVEDVEVLDSYAEVEDFAPLMKTIRESIEKNEPEVALDRLHTFVVKYVRRLCAKHGIPFEKKTPLHGLFGGYVKYLRATGALESQMAERILKSAIRILEDFNHVRNDKSLAHDNPLLNRNESILIFNFVASVIRFVETLEKEMSTDEQRATTSLDEVDLDEIPF